MTDSEPWKCPRCEFIGPHHTSLLVHYGTNHPNVVAEILNGDTSNLNIDMSFVPAAQTAQQQQQQQQQSQLQQQQQQLKSQSQMESNAVQGAVSSSQQTIHSSCKIF